MSEEEIAVTEEPSDSRYKKADNVLYIVNRKQWLVVTKSEESDVESSFTRLDEVFDITKELADGLEQGFFDEQFIDRGWTPPIQRDTDE